MKPRARRLTSAAACLTAGVIVVFVVLNWSTVRDHVEAWSLQLTRDVETIPPDPAYLELCKKSDSYTYRETREVLCLLASASGRPVIADLNSLGKQTYTATLYAKPTMQLALNCLQAIGCHIFEQRFPRRAYVIVQWDVSTLHKCVVCNKDIVDIDNVPGSGYEDGLVIMLCSDSCFARYVKKQHMGASGTELKAAASGTPRAEKH